jgi:transcriptional regulator with XRE-family HTH domain
MSKVSHFGDHIKKLRERRRLLQREISSQLNIDTPMLSKIERGERRAKKEYIPVLAELLNTNKKELLTLWLADQVYEVVKDESVALEALKLAEDDIMYSKK